MFSHDKNRTKLIQIRCVRSDVLEAPLPHQAAKLVQVFWGFFSGFVVQLTVKQGQVLRRYRSRASSFYFFLLPQGVSFLSFHSRSNLSTALCCQRTKHSGFFFSSFFPKPFITKQKKKTFNNIKIS